MAKNLTGLSQATALGEVFQSLEPESFSSPVPLGVTRPRDQETTSSGNENEPECDH